MKALLFDIDGTLVRCHGAGKSALMEAARETYGTFGTMDRFDFQGRTDPIIIRESLPGAGLDEAAIARGLPRMKERYFELLARNIETTGVELLPGVGELLEKLSDRDGVVLGLLTGNYEEGARIKLSAHNLYERFSFGVFGDDAAVRNDLPAVAKDRLRSRFNLDLPYRDMIIIGDTVHDIACAKHAGAVSVAVGTGWAGREVLLSRQPDFYFDDLGDWKDFIEGVVDGMG
jgi:phosphoglycolate phosphatase-like HAD superfamily hydrolase